MPPGPSKPGAVRLGGQADDRRWTALHDRGRSPAQSAGRYRNRYNWNPRRIRLQRSPAAGLQSAPCLLRLLLIIAAQTGTCRIAGERARSAKRDEYVKQDDSTQV